MKRIITILFWLSLAGNVVGQQYYYSMGDDKRVIFSPGNLQYNATEGNHVCADGTTKPGTWRFAEHQYDVVGDGNNNASATYDGWIDMFSWGTSGYNDKNPWGTAPAFPDTNVNITETYYDWGIYNPISNAENQWEHWRAFDKWELFSFIRRNDTKKVGRAHSVNGLRGWIFLPDNTDGKWTSEGSSPIIWTLNADETIKFVSAKNCDLSDWIIWTSASDSINQYTTEQWTLMENAGAIFLPFSTQGEWYGDYNHNPEGYTGTRYWTSSIEVTNSNKVSYACMLEGTQIKKQGDGPRVKSSKAFVRLVKDYQFKITTKTDNTNYGSVQIEGSEDGWYNVGAMAIITAVPKEGYSFVQWSDGNTDNPRTYKVMSPITFTAQFCNIKTLDIPDIENVEYGQNIPLVNLLNYFKINTSMKYSFEAHSSNDKIVYPMVMGNNLGFIQFGIGTANIEVSVTVASTTVKKSFNVTINPISIEEPCNLVVDSEIKNVSCFGAEDGTIETIVAGGIEPYTFLWNTGRTSSGIYNVQKGKYSVLVTDARGCSVSDTFSIEEPDKIIVSETINNSSCGGSDGTLIVNVSGGTGQYVINYSYDEETKTFAEHVEEDVLTMTGLSVGLYKIAVQDKKYEHCGDTLTYSLSEKDAPEINLINLKPSRCNEATGLIEISYSGGEEPYSFVWKDGNDTVVAPNITKRIVLPGRYTFSVMDSHNCKSVKSFEVEAIPFMQPQIALVSYGEKSHRNIVVWQKEKTNDIDKYNIYREQEKSGEYEKIGSVSYAENGLFVDSDADFKNKSYRYCLSAENTCMESSLSREAKTMNLKMEGDTAKELHLSWDAYEGCPYIQYYVYSVSLTGKEVIAELPYNTTNYTLKHKHGIGGYCIGVKLVNTIDLNTFLKAENGPFETSYSSIAEVENEFLPFSFINPLIKPLVFSKNKTIFISHAGENNIFVCDMTGKFIAQRQKVNSAEIPVKLAGVYVVIVGDKVFKVVVE